MMLEILNAGIDLLTKYLVGIHADPKAANRLRENFIGWSDSLHTVDGGYAIWRLVPIPGLEKRLSGYRIFFREVWQHEQKDGRSFLKEGIIWQLAYINPQKECLVIRVSPLSFYEEVVNDLRKEQNGRQVTYMHPSDYSDSGLRKGLKQADTAVVRVEFGRGETVAKDMLAQICVESIQSKFLESQDIYDYLRTYLLESAKRQRLRAPKELADQSVSELIAGWVLPDYPASFRHFADYLVSGKDKQEKRQAMKVGRPDNEYVDIKRDCQTAQDPLIEKPMQSKRRRKSPEIGCAQLRTVDEISAILDIPRDTIYSWIRTGRIIPTEVRAITGRRIKVRYGAETYEIPPASEPARKFYLFDDDAVEQIKRVSDGRKQMSLLRKLYSDKRRVQPRAARKWVATRLKQGLSVQEIAAEINGQRGGEVQKWTP